MSQLIKKLIINTQLEVLTGLHVGGSSDSVEIGGIDNPVIKVATKNGQPYIPGSSLKGKIRCLLEQIAGCPQVGGGRDKEYDQKTDKTKAIIDLFGFANDNKPSKIIVRDAYLSGESAKKLEENDQLDMPYTENKYENSIDRVRGVAESPRQAERVPAGAIFDVQFVINIWEGDHENSQLDLLRNGITALEADYLGGSGSRGYGQVKFSDLAVTETIDFSNYFSQKPA